MYNLTMDHNQLLKLNDQAVRLRESGQLEESIKLFDQIKTHLPALSASPDPTDQNTYVGLMGEQLIILRHTSRSLLQESLNQAREIYQWAINHQIKPPYLGYAIRGISNTLMHQGQYELAEPYLRQLITALDPNNSAYIGDSEAHLACCLLRQAKLQPAADLIDLALAKIDANTSKQDALRLAVWQSHAFWVKALILRSKGDTSSALDFANKALTQATLHDIQVRRSEAQTLVDLLTNE